MHSRFINHAKLVFATLTFIATLGSMIVGTVAWFASSSFLEISNFKITMGEAEQVEIGLVIPQENPTLGEAGTISYYESVNDDILIDHYYYNPWMQFKPVSSMFQSRWLNQDTDLTDPQLLPILRSSYKYGLNRKDTAVADDNFHQFELYLRANVRIDLYLDDDSYLIADEAKNRLVANQRGLNLSELNKVDDAMRVSFLSSEGFHIWEPNVSQAGTTEFGGRLDILNFDQSFDYDPDTKHEYMFGEYNDDSYLVYDESARVESVAKHTTFSAKSDPNAIPLSIPMSKDNGLVIAQETSVTTQYLTDMSNDEATLLRLYPNEPQRLVVTIYAEGWDRDMNNNINYANFSLNLVFGGRYAPL